MKKEELDRVLLNLSKIEIGMSKIYENFSTRKNFTIPTKNFWENIAMEEQEHAQVFEDFRKRLSEDPYFTITTTIDFSKLKDFTEKVNLQLKKIKGAEIRETDAYSFGAKLEGELSEAEFIDHIHTNDKRMDARLKYLKNALLKHNTIMYNYTKGIK
ncbi:MAG: ferritin family protein [Thermodesulfobacteriota bacterium]